MDFSDSDEAKEVGVIPSSDFLSASDAVHRRGITAASICWKPELSLKLIGVNITKNDRIVRWDTKPKTIQDLLSMVSTHTGQVRLT